MQHQVCLSLYAERMSCEEKQEGKHMINEEILFQKDETRYLLSLLLSMAEYFERPALAASIRLALQLNDSETY
jgi:hypothetical protein